MNERRLDVDCSLAVERQQRVHWFTFFHEACHILRHSDQLVYLDEHWDHDALSEQEQEANAFAAGWLIPDQFKDELPSLAPRAAVLDFAARMGIHPGIVVGRLQHDGLIDSSWMNDLKDTRRSMAVC